MIKISSAEKKYIVESIQLDTRADGRECFDYRPIILETGILSQSNGSARITVENSSTDVLVSIKTEICIPDLDAPNKGRVQVSVTCSPSVSAKVEGRVAEEMKTEINQAIDRLLFSSSNLDMESLCIIPGKSVWVVYVDVTVFDHGGNLHDVISAGIYAALSDAILPKIDLIGADDEDQDIQVESDPACGNRLSLESMPISITLSKIGSNFIVDATIEEELCVISQLSVSVDQKGRICGIQKMGTGCITSLETQLMIDVARNSAMKTFDIISKALMDQAKKDIVNSIDRIEKIGFFG